MDRNLPWDVLGGGCRERKHLQKKGVGNPEWEEGGSEHLCQKERAGAGGGGVMGMGKVGRGHREGLS